MADIPQPILPDKPLCNTNISPTSSELEKLLACRNASNCYSALNTYNSEIAAYNDIQSKRLSTAVTEYENRLKIHNARLDEWTNRKGEFAKYKNHGKNNEFWATSHDGTCWWGENWNEAHNWCHNAANNKGYDGENYWAKEWGWCYGRYGNFLCQKPKETILAQEQEYQAAKPQFFEVKPTFEKDFPKAEQLQLGTINIQCCSNTISGTGNFTDNIQQCQQEINQKISSITDVIPEPASIPYVPTTLPKPTETIESPQTPQAPQNLPSSQQININKDNVYILNVILNIVIVIIILACLCSVFAIVFK